MGQSEILEALENSEELTSVEIAELVDSSLTAVSHGIKRLLKDVSENVMARPLTQEEKEERYGKKVYCKINVYWIKK